MENIPLRENVWIRCRFGFDDAPQTLCTAAAYFHLTKGRAKRVEHLALGHLRENLMGKKYRMLHEKISCIHPIANPTNVLSAMPHRPAAIPQEMAAER